MTPSILAWTFIKQRSRPEVLDSSAKLAMESILETKAATVLQFLGPPRKLTGDF